MTNRLAPSYPEHAAVLERLSGVEQIQVAERIAIRACEMLEVRAIDLGLTQLGDLVDDLDEQAWSGPDPDAASQDLHTFLKARAVNALYFARDPAAGPEQAAESVYESVIALDDVQVMGLLRTFTAPTGPAQ